MANSSTRSELRGVRIASFPRANGRTSCAKRTNELSLNSEIGHPWPTPRREANCAEFASLHFRAQMVALPVRSGLMNSPIGHPWPTPRREANCAEFASLHFLAQMFALPVRSGLMNSPIGHSWPTPRREAYCAEFASLHFLAQMFALPVRSDTAPGERYTSLQSVKSCYVTPPPLPITWGVRHRLVLG